MADFGVTRNASKYRDEGEEARLPSSAAVYHGTLDLVQDEDTIERAERKFLVGEHQRVIESLFPGQEYQRIARYLAAWHIALENSGMSVDFADRHHYTKHTAWLNGIPLTSAVLKGIDFDWRKTVIESTPQYTPLKPSQDYEHEFDSNCSLCANLHQTEDANQRPDLINTNALAQVGDYVLLVNKFPYNVGDALILRRDHDDLSERADFDPSTRKWSKRKFTHTRDGIVSEEMLQATIELCDTLHLSAQRNHALDGKSIPLHEHIKVLPDNLLIVRPVEAILKPELVQSDLLHIYSPEGAPQDHLVLVSGDKELLAQAAAKLLARLERADEVFTFAYHKGHIIIAPRVSSLYGDGNLEGWLGSTVSTLTFSDATQEGLQRAQKFIPKKGGFDWQSFLDGLSAEVDLRHHSSSTLDAVERTRKIALSCYTPLDYEDYVLGSDQLLEQCEPPLHDSVHALFTELKPLQDKRFDPGHAESVVYFTNQLSMLHQLSDEDREVACLSAVLHDVGYADIDGITEKYAEISRKMLSDDPEEIEEAKRLDHQIRVEHQRNGVEAVRKYLRGHPRIEEIVTIVGHHDTRANTKPTVAEKIMRDGDFLARVSLSAYHSMIARDDRLNCGNTLQLMEDQLRLHPPKKLSSAIALQMGRMEFANTINQLRNSGLSVPEYLLSEYETELQLVSEA